MVETWCLYVTYNRVSIPDVVTSQDRSPQAVTGGGEGEGEGGGRAVKNLEWGCMEAWRIKGFGVSGMAIESLHGDTVFSLLPTTSVVGKPIPPIYVGLTDLNPRVPSYLSRGAFTFLRIYGK